MTTPQKNNATATWLLERNRIQSEDHSSPGAINQRKFYRAKHSTEITAFKCMDGRLNLPVYAKIPAGIIQPFRTMGGIFDLGDERLGKIIEEWVDYAIEDKGRRCMPLCTYHFSKGDTHRGCAGHKYNTTEALIGAKRLAEQFRFTYSGLGSGRGYGNEVYPIVVGLETDYESLLLHSEDGSKVFAVEDHLGASIDECRDTLVSMYPSMADGMLQDLLKLVEGNQQHIRDVKNLNREPIELEHRESVICFGRGFDWLHEPNKALIIGPFGNDLSSSITTAGSLLLKNINEGRIDPEKGLVVMTAGLYYKEGMNKNRIMLKAYDLYRYIKSVLEKNVPELMEKYDVQYLVGVTSHHTRLFTQIDVENFKDLFDNGFTLSEAEKEAITVSTEVVETQ